MGRAGAKRRKQVVQRVPKKAVGGKEKGKGEGGREEKGREGGQAGLGRAPPTFLADLRFRSSDPPRPASRSGPLAGSVLKL